MPPALWHRPWWQEMCAEGGIISLSTTPNLTPLPFYFFILVLCPPPPPVPPRCAVPSRAVSRRLHARTGVRDSNKPVASRMYDVCPMLKNATWHCTPRKLKLIMELKLHVELEFYKGGGGIGYYTPTGAADAADGFANQVMGKVNNVIGSMTGNTEKLASGKAQETAGQAKKEANKPI
ncbi:hypothetical protein B0H13DRAFT_2264034 [Mycena leptocephala]|nr:hypothetical protein B0H13DRAFT_2264034 [Mycena leptocephala]